MAAMVTFWQRVSNALRPGVLPLTGAGEDGRGVVMHGADDAAIEAVALSGGDGDLRAVSWWRRRQIRQAQAREVSLRVVVLADALQQHFRQQDERTADMAHALQRIGGTLEQLAENQRAQGDCLQSIAQHTDAAGKQAAALSDTLRRVPESLLAQAEALRTVARHLEVSQESDTQLMHTMQRFGQVVGTLSSAGTAQVETLQRLHAAQGAQHEAFVALVGAQSRRFLLILFVGGVLAVAGLAALGVTLAIHLKP